MLFKKTLGKCVWKLKKIQGNYRIKFISKKQIIYTDTVVIFIWFPVLEKLK